jgi:ribonuclease BN (tRNA processing enzyme)
MTNQKNNQMQVDNKVHVVAKKDSFDYTIGMDEHVLDGCFESASESGIPLVLNLKFEYSDTESIDIILPFIPVSYCDIVYRTNNGSIITIPPNQVSNFNPKACKLEYNFDKFVNEGNPEYAKNYFNSNFKQMLFYDMMIENSNKNLNYICHELAYYYIHFKERGEDDKAEFIKNLGVMRIFDLTNYSIGNTKKSQRDAMQLIELNRDYRAIKLQPNPKYQVNSEIIDNNFNDNEFLAYCDEVERQMDRLVAYKERSIKRNPKNINQNKNNKTKPSQPGD